MPEYWEESWRLAVTQNPVRKHQLILVEKTLKGVFNNDNKRVQNYTWLCGEDGPLGIVQEI